MPIRLGLLLLFILVGGLLSGLHAEHLRPPAPPAAAPPPSRPEMYTFPAVSPTPDATARARLVCADMGDYGWSVARRRERTGVTLDEALLLLAQEQMGTAAFRPRERVIHLVYADPEGTPAWARGVVQRVCLREMLGEPR
jgi:hypothetical protein